MESGVGYWEHRALPQFGDQWHLESYRYHSGSSSWKMGGVGGANYGDGCDAELRTPPFLIPEQGKLTFWHRIDTEQADGALAWDGGLVEIATGMGPWTVLTPADYTHVFRRLILLPSGTPCYSGSIDWSRVEVDLSGYSGVAQIRFRFISDGNTTDEGWYVDDVEVTGCCQGKVGNIDRYGIVDLVDLSLLVSYLTGHGDNLSCHAIANINGQGIVDLADLSALVSYLTGGGYRLPDCL